MSFKISSKIPLIDLQVHSSDSHDREHLAYLMRDFPVQNPPDVNQALKLIHLRFSQLDPEKFAVALSPLGEQEFKERLYSLPWKMHQYLFQGIISNAGFYRNLDDPG